MFKVVALILQWITCSDYLLVCCKLCSSKNTDHMFDHLCVFIFTRNLKNNQSVLYTNAGTKIRMCITTLWLWWFKYNCLFTGRNIVLWKASDVILKSVAMKQPVRVEFKYCSGVLTSTCIRKCFAYIGCKLKVTLKKCVPVSTSNVILTVASNNRLL